MREIKYLLFSQIAQIRFYFSGDFENKFVNIWYEDFFVIDIERSRAVRSRHRQYIVRRRLYYFRNRADIFSSVDNCFAEQIFAKHRVPGRPLRQVNFLAAQSFGGGQIRYFPEFNQNISLVRTIVFQSIVLAAAVNIFYAGKIKLRVKTAEFEFAFDAVRAGDDAEEKNQFTPRIS
jgi:hypothetical protein